MPSADGAITLRWDGDDHLEVEVQQAGGVEFTAPVLRYRGTDAGTVLTGLAEGSHYFRIREMGPPDGPWSAPLRVSVEFFPRRRLFLFLGLGAAVVLATIGTIVGGYFQTRRREKNHGEALP